MKFIRKSLTSSSSGEQVRSAIALTFRNHAAAVKAAVLVHYVDKNGLEKSFNALTSSLEPLFTEADRLDNEVIVSCLLAAGYRSGRDLTALENAVKTAESAAAPLIKRDDSLRRQAGACRESDTAKHSAIMAEVDKLKPELAAASDALAKARAALELALMEDIHAFINGFEKRAEMLTAISKWLYENATEKFGVIAAAADTAVKARAADFAGRMLSYVDEIADDDKFPLNVKGRRCSCGADIEGAIMKAVKRPFNGGVGYKHTATGGTRYCDVPIKAGNEVTINKVAS